MAHDELMDMMIDEFISTLVDMEIDGYCYIEEMLDRYADENRVDYDDLRRLYGDELVSRGLA